MNKSIDYYHTLVAQLWCDQEGRCCGRQQITGYMCKQCAAAYAITKLRDRVEYLTQTAAQENEEMCQLLGKALNYPWFKDDQKNFPGATKEAGVCVGDHIAITLVLEAAKRIRALEEALGRALDIAEARSDL